MIKTKLTKTLLIAVFTLLLFASCADAATINVGSGYTYSTIGSGMAAASSGDTVYIHSGTYTLTSPVVLKTGVIVHGDGYSSTIVRATDKSKFASEAEPALFFGTSVSDVEIYGIKFQGPAESIADIHDEDQTYYGGHDDYHIAVRIKTGTNIRIHDCYATLLLGDFVRASGTSYLYIYNNIVNTCGHDGSQLYNVKNTLWYNNYVNVLMNNGVRISDSSGGNNTVRQNTFTNALANSGWCCVQLQGSSTGILVEKNVFTRTTDNYPCAGYSYTGSGSTIRNNVGYSIPSSFLYNLGSATASNNSVYTTEYNWSAWGYGYNAAVTTGGGGGAAPDEDPETPVTPVYSGSPLPTLVYPSASSTVAPVNGHISFSWSNVGSSMYSVQVATDSGFSSLVADSVTSSTALSVAVNNGTTYYWKVKAYNDAGSAWTSYTSARSVTTTTSVSKVVGVYGTIYTSIAQLPVAGAVVTMSNDTWSGAYVTGDNGYYEFSVLSSTGIYYITVTATEYISPQYQLPVNASDYVEKNIALAKSPTYFAPHNVKLIVTDSYLRHRYNAANVALYVGESEEAVHNDTTGVDGSVTFELEEDVKYRVVTTYGGVTNIDYIVPSDTKYYIIINTSGIALVNEQLYDNITANVSKNEVNTTTAYINVSYLDNSSRTTNVTYILGRTEENGTFVEEQNSSAIDGSNSSYTFTVNDYLGKDYVVKLEINHTAFGHRTKAFAVMFGANTSPFADYKEMAYLAVFILFIVATQFGKQEHASGSIVLCAMAWLMWFMGMFRPLGDTLNGMIFAGAVAATVYAMISYINSTRDGVY